MPECRRTSLVKRPLNGEIIVEFMKLKSKFSYKAAPVARRSTVGSSRFELNPNALPLLDEFLEFSDFPYFCRRVVNKAVHFRRLSQSKQHTGNVFDVY